MRKSKKRGGRQDRGGSVASRQGATRHIYQYFDGQKQVKADPMQINRDLLAYPGLNLERDIQLTKIAADGNPKIQQAANDAYDRLLGAIRQAFKVKTFAEGGLADLECLELFNDFGEWWGEVKKKLNILPTSTKPMGSTGGGSVTKSVADSQPTSTESKPCEASPSPLESASSLEPSCPVNGSMP